MDIKKLIREKLDENLIVESNRDIVLAEYPKAQITPVAKNPNVYGGPMVFHVTYPKEVRGKIKNMSIGKGDSPEEAWEQAKILINANKQGSKSEAPADENLNKDLIDRIEKIKSERNWNSLGSIYHAQVGKFAEKISFDVNDIGSRVKVKQAKTWDDLISIIKKSKLKMGFRG
jgi:hypothetical protein